MTFGPLVHRLERTCSARAGGSDGMHGVDTGHGFAAKREA